MIGALSFCKCKEKWFNACINKEISNEIEAPEVDALDVIYIYICIYIQRTHFKLIHSKSYVYSLTAMHFWWKFYTKHTT